MEVSLGVGEAPEDESGDELSREAVRLYLTCGSLASVSRKLDTPIYELQKLAKTQWWTDELGRLRRIEQAELDAKLSDILGSALTKLVDRMENGEEVMDKEGFIHRKAISAATLCRIAETVFDKRQLIRGLPTAVTNEGSKLTELAEKLEKLGLAQSARTIEMEK
jgi:hypothetical protein